MIKSVLIAMMSVFIATLSLCTDAQASGKRTAILWRRGPEQENKAAMTWLLP